MNQPCKVGDRIELLEMPNDPAPIPAGTKGTVVAIQDSFGDGKLDITVKWDIPRSLKLIHPIDKFRMIE